MGFISSLPHELVEAFRATLDEVKEADIILHVRDIASPESEAEAADVRKVLEELAPARKPASACWKSGTRSTCCQRRPASSWRAEPSFPTAPRWPFRRRVGRGWSG
ncbi:MAG: hypothetical protein WDM85_11075 [Caulobacteraceae bacterium]